MSNFNVWKTYAAKSCCYFTNMNGFSYILSDWFLHEHSTSQGILDDKDCLLLQLAIFLLLFLVIAGAWLGFWVVHKLVLAEDGSIDIGVSHFVAWSIRFIASALILQVSIYMIILRIHLILQSSLTFCLSLSLTRVQLGTDESSFVLQSSVDPLLCAEAWIFGALISSILRRLCRPKYVLRFFKWVSFFFFKNK